MSGFRLCPGTGHKDNPGVEFQIYFCQSWLWYLRSEFIIFQTILSTFRFFAICPNIGLGFILIRLGPYTSLIKYNLNRILKLAQIVLPGGVIILLFLTLKVTLLYIKHMSWAKQRPKSCIHSSSKTTAVVLKELAFASYNFEAL